MVLVPWKYYRSLTSYSQQMNELFERFFRNELARLGGLAPSFPKTTIQEARNRYLVTIDVQGFLQEDLRVTVEKDTLNVEGRRQSATEEGKGNVPSGSFKRTLRFNHELSENTTARYCNEKLIVHIPKTPPRRAKKILITS